MFAAPKEEDKLKTEDKEREELKERAKWEGLLARYKEGLKMAKEKVAKLEKEKEIMSAELKSKVEELSKQQQVRAYVHTYIHMCTFVICCLYPDVV